MDPAAGQVPPGLLAPAGADGAPALLPPGFAFPGVMGGMALPGAGFAAPLPAAAIPGMNDPTVLSQLAGIPAGLIRDMPTMAAAAQNLSMQHLIQQQQQMAALAAGALPFPMMGAPGVQPAAPLPPAGQSGSGGRGAPRGRPKGARTGAGRGAAAAAAAAAAVPPPDLPLVKEDPGGKVIWAKTAHLPWWPAKMLDPGRDRSYPPDADPPRPTAIPIRFFGTHEFAWLGSKRAVTEWEEGLAQHGGGGDADGALAAAVAEARAYLADRTLPNAFYIQPEPENAKRPAKGGRKRGAPYRNARDEGGVAAGGMTLGITPMGHLVQMMAPAAAATPPAPPMGRPRQRGPAEPSPAERAALVHERKKARLRDMGLLPPEDSPFVCGAAAANPALLERAAGWEAAAPAAMAAAREEAAGPAATAPPRATVAPPPPPPPEAEDPGAAAAAAAQAQVQAAQAHQAAAVAAAMGMGGIPMMGTLGGVMPMITPEQMQAMQDAMMSMQAGMPFG